MDMNDNVISKADLWADRIHAFQVSIPDDSEPSFRKHGVLPHILVFIH